LGSPDLFTRLKDTDKEIARKAFDHYVLACDPSIMGSGDYTPTPTNGAEYLPEILGKQKIAIYAAAMPEFLHEAYRLNGLDKVISHIFSICDAQLNEGNEVGRKTPEMYAVVKTLLKAEGLKPAAYLSHKPAEARIGADVYGLGILIGEQQNTRSENILVVPSINSSEFKKVVANL